MLNSSPTPFDSTRAWIVSIAAFVASFVAYGFLYSFGSFLKPIGSAFGVSHALMSTLFSCMSLSGYVLGPWTGDWADHVGPRKVMVSGALVFTGGLIATAHATNFVVAFACLGVGVGSGLASVYVPSLAAVGEWFKKDRAVAIGIAVSGIGVGTLVAAPLSAWLIREYGWRTTLTIQGIGGGSLLLLSALFMFKPPVKVESKRGSRAVWAKVRSRPFLLVFLSRLLSGIPVFVTMVYLPALATKEGVASVSAAALVGYIGAGSLLSRLGLNAAAEKIGAIIPFQFSCVLVAVACVIWMFAYSYPALVVFVIVMGISYGGVASLTPAVAIQIFGLENIGELLGFLLMSYGVAAVVGPPIAGVLVDRSGNYRDIIWFALIASLAGVVTSALIRRAQPAAENETSEAAA